MKDVRLRRVGRAVLLAGVLGAAGGGCQYETIRRAQFSHRGGSPEVAQADLAELAADDFAGPHRILGWLELGSADHASGRYGPSSRALLRAEAGFDEQDARPRTSVTEEVFAAATSPLSVAYRGSATDRVMAPTLRAVNALMMGDDEGARLALNEAAFRQDASIRARAGAIERARLDGSSSGVDYERSAQAAMGEPGVESLLASVRGFSPYAGFVNPFTEMLHSVVRLSEPRDAADVERGLALLRSVSGTTQNRYAKGLLLELEREDGTPDRGASVHVFFATGFCPYRDEVRLDLPLFLFNDTVDYVGVAFPRLAFNDDAVGSLTAETTGEMVRTELLADMDRLVAVEYREAFPALLTRALVSAAAKTAASYGINEATGDDETINAAARIVAGLYLYSQNRADTRSWSTLPKRYEYARLAAPPEGEVLLTTPDGQSVFVEVAPDADTIVFVRSLRPGVGLRVSSVLRRAVQERGRSGSGNNRSAGSSERPATKGAGG